MSVRQVHNNLSLRCDTKIFAAILVICGALTLVPGLAHAAGKWVNTQTKCKVWNSDSNSDDVANWSGRCLRGRVHGWGTLTWSNKKDGKLITRFVGKYDRGQRTGMGFMVDPRGNWFKGPFVNGAAHGHGWCFYAPLKIRRTCEFKSGKLVGY